MRTEEQEEWIEVLRRVVRYDFYHLPQYHRVEERRVGAMAHLFTYCEGDYLIALPLLLRPVGGGPSGWNDATSVYGYGGPVASHESMPQRVVQKFQAALREALVERRVIAVFSRLHPLIAQYDLLAGLGECRSSGRTVSIDLTLPVEGQRAQYRGGHKRLINKQRREGIVTCLYDQEKRFLSEFVSIYEETMRRVNAEHTYFFREDYFSQLVRELRPVLQLFVAVTGGKAAAGGLVTSCNGIVQYHLGGTRDEFVKLSPMTLILDTVRLWANEIGARAFHLGGGVGAKEDSLFSYKAGFSDRRHNFKTWRWVLAPEIYGELCERRARINRLQGLELALADYFPAYRSPVLPRVPVERAGAQIKNDEPRIYLSPPHMGEAELELVKDAFASNWIAPVGPHLDSFEKEFAEYLGMPHAAALSSGTAAIHLALRLLRVQPGDEVLCSTLTFAASANPIIYEGGTPVFIDSEPASWNMDPVLLREELNACAARGRLPRAVIVVDLYGQSADYDPILEACARYKVPIIQDSAEALGATYKGRKTGTQGRCGVFSFNGNKIITTSGGGMLVSDDPILIEGARFLATQARDSAPHYQHSTIGFNYRMSNVLAGIGRGQLRVLTERIAARRRNFERYKVALGSVPGIEFMPLASYGEANFWLTCITIDPEQFGATREDVRLALANHNIEARPIWKPLHLQPVFAHSRVRGGSVAEALFACGLCLPSGSSLTGAELDRICATVLATQK
ncbi:MAG: GNAT family N-acetyltransferase [Verrucomicrobia bacterium]|nr:GNAT family N-acetyltransferase [Verrucomicrobiota bacterium]